MAQKETLLNPILKEKQKLKIVPILLGVALAVMTATAIYFYWQNTELKKNPQSIAQEEVKAIVARVSRLIVLPEGEIPTIATVTDTNLLKDQPFFAKAKTGDKVLIYTNAKKAILYDPVADKIVEVAPLNIGNTQGSASNPPATPETK